LSKPMHAKLLNRVAAGNSEAEPLISSLTPSEFEVLHLIGSGHSSQEIAKLLSRSIKTIETHRFNIRTKLNLKDGADLIRYATHWSEAQ
jgi:DNA-binding NarL/FixJ family response regulator